MFTFLIRNHNRFGRIGPQCLNSSQFISPGSTMSRADGWGRWIVLSALWSVMQLLSVRQEQSMIGLVFLEGTSVCEAIFICCWFTLRCLSSSDRSTTLKHNTPDTAMAQQALHSKIWLFQDVNIYISNEKMCMCVFLLALIWTKTVLSMLMEGWLTFSKCIFFSIRGKCVCYLYVNCDFSSWKESRNIIPSTRIHTSLSLATWQQQTCQAHETYSSHGGINIFF